MGNVKKVSAVLLLGICICVGCNEDKASSQGPTKPSTENQEQPAGLDTLEAGGKVQARRNNDGFARKFIC